MVVLRGIWNLRSLEPVLPAIESRLVEAGPGAAWDLSDVPVMDHAGALLLWRAWGRRMADSVNLRADQALLFERLSASGPPETVRRQRHWIRPLLGLGTTLISFGAHFVGVLALLGSVALDALHLVRQPLHVPWKEISANV